MSAEAPSCQSNPGAMPRSMAYIKDVQKRLLPEREETYQQFLKLFSDYIGGKSLEQMKTEIRELLKGDPDLIEGFEKFLPANAPEKGAGEGVEQEGRTI